MDLLCGPKWKLPIFVFKNVYFHSYEENQMHITLYGYSVYEAFTNKKIEKFILGPLLYGVIVSLNVTAVDISFNSQSSKEN